MAQEVLRINVWRYAERFAAVPQIEDALVTVQSQVAFKHHVLTLA
jgi:hypothetical protein